MTRRLSVLACLIALTLSACAAAPEQEPSSSPPPLVPGSITPSDPDGYRAALRSWEGTPVVVNFWASWCVPCTEEMPLLVASAREHESRVAFLGVNSKDYADAAREFVERFDVNFPSLADPDGEIMRAERVLGLPVTKFYRADGVLAFVSHGQVDEETLAHRVDELLRIG